MSYGGINGLNQAIDLATEALGNLKFVHEKKLIGKFFVFCATISCMVSILIHVFCVTQIPGTVSIYNKLFVSKNSIASLSLVSSKYINLISGKYFDEISQNTSKFCFGVDDTFRALEMGAVETLIVWENLDVNRYVLRNHTTNGKSQETDHSKSNKLVLSGKIDLL